MKRAMCGIAIGIWASFGALTVAGDGPTARAPVDATDQSEPTFDARLEEIDSRVAQIVRLKANFRQIKKTPLLKEPLESSGTILVKDDRLRWDTLKPAPSTLLIDPNMIRIYYPEAAVVEEYVSSEDMRLLSGTPLPRLAMLRQHFSLSLLDSSELGAPPGETRFVGVLLTPSGSEVSKHLKSARVLLDGDVPCVRKLVLSDLDGEVSEIEFTDIQVGAEISDEQLNLKIPEGTRVSRPLGERGPTSVDTGRSDPADTKRPADADVER